VGPPGSFLPSQGVSSGRRRLKEAVAKYPLGLYKDGFRGGNGGPRFLMSPLQLAFSPYCPPLPFPTPPSDLYFTLFYRKFL